MSQSAEFFAAVAAGQIDRVREQLASDPTLAAAKDEHGATALHHAAERGNREVVTLLLESGADMNARDDEFGRPPPAGPSSTCASTAASWASRSRTWWSRSERGDFLGAPVGSTRLPALAKAKDSQGKPLAQHAHESGNDEVARLFEQAAG